MAGVNQDVVLRGLKTFKNVWHRMERVTDAEGVVYINDSKATNLESVKYALDAFPSPIIWIAGGVDKGNEYQLIHALAKEKVKALIALGKDNAKLTSAFSKVIPLIRSTDNLIEAVRWAKELSTAGDTVLLAPACASFDLFENYKDRGNQFKKAVMELTTQNERR